MQAKLQNETVSVFWAYPDTSTFVYQRHNTILRAGEFIDFELPRTNETGVPDPIFSVMVTTSQLILKPVLSFWVRNQYPPPAWLTLPLPMFSAAAFNGPKIVADALSGGAAYDASTTVKEPDGSALSTSRLTESAGVFTLNLAGLSFRPTDSLVVNL